MAELNRTFRHILRRYGHNIILQRRTTCGTAWQDRLEKHTVRHMYPATRGLPGISQDRPEGIVHTVDMIYYFLPDAKPREGDRIYEEDDRFVSPPNEYPKRSHIATKGGQTTWIIDYALPMRGVGGRIVFWAAGVTRETPN